MRAGCTTAVALLRSRATANPEISREKPARVNRTVHNARLNLQSTDTVTPNSPECSLTCVVPHACFLMLAQGMPDRQGPAAGLKVYNGQLGQAGLGRAIGHDS
jgi:hypothetical protein